MVDKEAAFSFCCSTDTATLKGELSLFFFALSYINHTIYMIFHVVHHSTKKNNLDWQIGLLHNGVVIARQLARHQSVIARRVV